jgi:hypothetical protein
LFVMGIGNLSVVEVHNMMRGARATRTGDGGAVEGYRFNRDGALELTVASWSEDAARSQASQLLAAAGIDGTLAPT